MLIYNYQKNFVGIDESSLKTLGFSSFLQLISKTQDFANLFVRTPGYIHNFQHVHWIDFVMCAEPNQESKVIINANDKDFTCNLDIKSFYLKEDPNETSYIVNLVNLRALTQEEPTIEVSEKVVKFEDDYIYNSKLACDELGLPQELIEEFIEDFIAQANNVKADLYNSLGEESTQKVKTLSHKLKGVAANLRIEDAFEMLSTINKSDDLLEIEHNLNMFYKTIDNLSKS